MIPLRHPALLLLLALAATPGLPQTSASQSSGPQSSQQQSAPVAGYVPKPKPITLTSPAGTPQTSTAPASTGPKSSTATAPATAAPKTRTLNGTPILTQSFPVPPKPSTAGAKASTGPQAAASKPQAAKPIAAKPPSAAPTAAPVITPAIAAQAATQSPAPPAQPVSGTLNRTTIVLDPAHGGVDSGSRIGESILEKDVALALAFKLRSLLTARGFTVVMTRDSDAPSEPSSSNTPGALPTLDDRAGIANHARAAACLLLHATGSGNGVHLYSSELPPADGETAILPWLTAQAAWVPQSQSLEKQISTALARAHIPLVSSSASVRPVDSLTCPALVIELAPSTANDADTINDGSYQQHVAEAVATSLIFWQNQVQPPVRIAPATAETKAISTTGDQP